MTDLRLALLLACLLGSGCDSPGTSPETSPGTSAGASPGTSAETLPETSPESAATGAVATAGFARALQPRRFVFPADHGPHPAFRDEWWYATGNLYDSEQRRYGFQLTLFRRALQPGLSANATGQSYMGHFALTDVQSERFHQAERFGRPLAGIAGSSAEPPRVWLDDWQLHWEEGGWTLRAAHAAWDLSLRLTPAGAPVLQGEEGLSPKGPRPGNASYYYSQPRMSARGLLRHGESERAVTGTAWLDREWGSSELAPEQQGWDWFALQLQDGRALMLYQLRREDGGISDFSSGTLIDAAGRRHALRADQFRLQPLSTWRSPGGAAIPVHWRLTVPARNIDWQVRAVLPQQYWQGRFRYWEGAVDVLTGEERIGHGYLEMTGYEQSR